MTGPGQPQTCSHMNKTDLSKIYTLSLDTSGGPCKKPPESCFVLKDALQGDFFSLCSIRSFAKT